MPNIIHSGGGVNIMTLPDQITNLACVGGTDGTAGTIDVSFTEVSSTSWSLLQNYLLVYKAGSIPQTPFDGTRIVLPKGTAGAQKTYQITGLTFDQLYGVRIYPVSTRYQHQTAAEGATATVTPVSSIMLSNLPASTSSNEVKIKLLESGINTVFILLKHNYVSGRALVSRKFLVSDSIAWDSNGSGMGYDNHTLDNWHEQTYFYRLSPSIRNIVSYISLQCVTNGSQIITISRRTFTLSGTEYGMSDSSWMTVDGVAIPYYSSSSNRIGKIESGSPKLSWTRSPRDSDEAWTINTDGTPFRSLATNAYQVRPAFTLPENMLLKATPDVDGCYLPL